ncbi:MAG: helix-turn-helix domain-containing protein [Burkholderiales bacterium]
MTEMNLEDLITPAEAAALRGVSRQAISDLIKREKLQTWEIGGRTFVSRKAVLNYEAAPSGRPAKTVSSDRRRKTGGAGKSSH